MLHVDLIRETGSAERKSRLAWPVLILVALAPLAMSVIAWTPDGHVSPSLFWLRFFAPPILVIELIVIGGAMVRGFGMVAAVRGLPHWAVAAVAGLIAIALGTTLFVAPDRGMAIIRGAIALTHVIFGFAVAQLLRECGFARYRALAWALVVGSVGYVALLIVYVVVIPDESRFDWLHFGLGVVNIRHTGFYAIIGAALSLGLVARETRAWRGAFALFAATMCCAIFFWSGSRGPVLAICCAVGLSIGLVPALRTWRLAGATVIALIGGAALSLTHFPPHPSYGLLRILFSGGMADVNDVSSGRLELWRGTWRKAMEHPLLGFGEGQFLTVVPESHQVFHHPHNAILQILLQWGGIGLLLCLALAGAAWWRMLHIVRSARPDLAPAFLAINALLIYSLYDGVIFFVYPMMIFSFLVAVVLAAGSGPIHRSV